MRCTAGELDHFVATSDSLGGPGSLGCQNFWSGFCYEPTYLVNQELDPFSEEYVSEQIKLYEEISGRVYDVRQHEMSTFDVERHIAATNPYDHSDPGALAVHLQRLSRALRFAGPQRGEVLLDMGCGWGLSSELAAYLGLTVIAVDVNPSFVRLVNERAKRGKRLITAMASTFEEFTPSEPADIALFYECLHHAVRPWLVLRRLVNGLKQGGRLVLAGEPINNFWWKNWGMRLDPISIYCIRKYGWFESGWSLDFLRKVVHRSGFVPRTYPDSDSEIGYAIVGEKIEFHKVPGNVAAELFDATGCISDTNWLIFTGDGALTLSFPLDTTKAVLNISNFRGRELRVTVTRDGMILFNGEMRSGSNTIDVPRLADTANLRFEVEGWVPNKELHNGDGRTLGMHLECVTFERG